MTEQEIRAAAIDAANRLHDWCVKNGIPKTKAAMMLSQIQPDRESVTKMTFNNFRIGGIPVSRAWAVDVLTSGEVAKHETAPHIYPQPKCPRPAGIKRPKWTASPREYAASL